MDTNGWPPVQFSYGYESAGRSGPGCSGDVVRAARARRVGGPDRSARRRRSGVATTRLGRHHSSDHRQAPPFGVHSQGVSGLRGSGCGHRRHDAPVHGSGGAPSAGNSKRIGILGSADGCIAPGAWPRSVAGSGRRGRRASHRTMGRDSRSGRCGVRTRCGALLGDVHSAHPARRRRGCRYQRAGGVDGGSRVDRDNCRRPLGYRAADSASDSRGPRTRDLAARRAVRSGDGLVAKAVHGGVRHADESRACFRAAYRSGCAATGSECSGRGRYRVRRRRRDRRGPRWCSRWCSGWRPEAD